MNSIYGAINASSRRFFGIVILVFTILLTMNYSSNPEDNWITKVADRIIENKVWEWLGTYLKTHLLRVLHCFWIASAAFLAARIELATMVTLIMSALTLHMQPTTNTDMALQCLFIYMLLSVRNSVMRLLTAAALVLTIIFGHAFKQYAA